MDAFAHRLQFAFTITYHYLFPQLTMGLAFLIFILKSLALFRGDVVADQAARLLTKILGLGFIMGIVTGIPMEFQFGTNWARFSQRTGGVIGHMLAMEGIFAFFVESTFLYGLMFEQRRLGPRLHWFTSLMVWLGTWTSGFFVVCANAFMQHPVGYTLAPDGVLTLTDLGAVLTNPWVFPQFAHTVMGTVITGSFATAALSAFYLLRGHAPPKVRLLLRLAVITGTVACFAAAFPTGDLQAKAVAKHQPVTFAAMEGHFETQSGAPLVLVGQPNVATRTLDNPIRVPNVLSFLTHQRWNAEIKGLDAFPPEEWPDNVPLLYYSYHIMAGLGTLFIGLMLASAVWLYRGALHTCRPLLWCLLLALPLPFIANTAGWHTAELGRQPWLVHGVLKTVDGYSDNVSAGNVIFSLLGFLGLYSLLSLLFVLLLVRIVKAELPTVTLGESGPGEPGEPGENGLEIAP